MRNAKSSLIAVCLATLLSWTVTFSQDLTHPLDMDLPASSFQRPDPVDYLLAMDNGLVAYIASADQVPLVTFSAFIKAGKVSDTHQGAAEVLLDALQNAGPSNSTPADFKRLLRQMTARYTVEMHDEWTEISLNVPTEDMDEALRLFAAVIQSPALLSENIDKFASKTGAANSDLGGESGPALYEGSLGAAVDKFYEVLYDGHPFGLRPSASDFSKLTIEDVEKFHADYFVPGNMTLAVAGDIDYRSIEVALSDLFEGMEFRDSPDPVDMPAIDRMKSRQHTFPVRKLQSWLVFGHDLPVVPAEDQAALEVMNYILAGGHLYTRMTVETRYKYGYTNDASGFLEDRWSGPGGYTFRSYSRPEVIEPIYDNMMNEIFRIRRELISDEDLFIAKGALTDGAFQVQYLDGYTTARNFAIERLRYGNHEQSSTYVERIRSVTAEDVRDAANKYIQPDRMQVILVGEPAELLN